jgi:hypothetical protein
MLLGCLAGLALRLERSASPLASGANGGLDAYCSFCGVSDVEYTLAGRSSLWMCGPCVALLEDIFRQGGKEDVSPCSFCSRGGELAAISGPSFAVCASCVHDAAQELKAA